VGQVPQKLVTFCKLYHNDVIWKKAKQYFVNLALYVGGFIHRVKCRHISVVAIRSPFLGQDRRTVRS